MKTKEIEKCLDLTSLILSVKQYFQMKPLLLYKKMQISCNLKNKKVGAYFMFALFKWFLKYSFITSEDLGKWYHTLLWQPCFRAHAFLFPLKNKNLNTHLLGLRIWVPSVMQHLKICQKSCRDFQIFQCYSWYLCFYTTLILTIECISISCHVSRKIKRKMSQLSIY